MYSKFNNLACLLTFKGELDRCWWILVKSRCSVKLLRWDTLCLLSYFNHALIKFTSHTHCTYMTASQINSSLLNWRILDSRSKICLHYSTDYWVSKRSGLLWNIHYSISLAVRDSWKKIIKNLESGLGEAIITDPVKISDW